MSDDIVTFEHFQIARRDDGSLFELGRGAMGVTYKAYDTRLDGFVALKVINPGYLNDDVGRERFLREARAAAHLDHPNVAAIFHRGQEGGTYFYAMQFIEGETLDAFVRRRGPLPVPLALRLIMQAAQGLAAANARGLIHRDIKPANLMLVHLDESGVASKGGAGAEPNDEDLLVKVIDFGLAKVVLDEKNGSGLSLTGDGPIGTPYYMSPEQIDSSNGDVDARTDIYSLGVTLWYLLTGQPPFVGTQFQVFRQHIGAPPPVEQLPVKVPQNVRELLQRMMAKSPTERPATTRDLITGLRDLLRGPLTPADTTAAAPPVPMPPIPVAVPSPTAMPLRATPPPFPSSPSPAGTSGLTAAPTIPPSTPPSLPSPYTPTPASPPPAAYAPAPSPPTPYTPPQFYPVAEAPARGHGREWLIFVGVLLAALVLGGIPLGYYITHAGHSGSGDKESATSLPVASSSPTPEPSAVATTSPPPRPSAVANASRNRSASDAASFSPAPGSNVINVPGQYMTIQLAMAAAHKGDTVRVATGVYKEKIVFKDGVRLIGAGIDQTFVQTNGTGEALDVKDCSSGAISGFTFEHTGPNPANEVDYVVWLHGSAVHMRECRIRNSGSVGLSCEENDHSMVEDCEFTGCKNVGLRSMGAGSAPTFRGNHCFANGTTGISFSKGAGGLAENNTSEDNVEFGFSIMDEKTAPTLNGNTVRGNTYSGFTYQSGGGGVAQDNTVENNKEAGFRVAGKGSAPTITRNRIRSNNMSGLIFLEACVGMADANTIEANAGAGILVKNAGTAPMLTNNHITNNKLNGIYYGDGAIGTAQANIISGNVEGGFVLSGKGTAPTVRENQVRENSTDGIGVFETAAGTIDANVCEDNERYGIAVYGAGSSPVVGTNQLKGNKKQDYYTETGATPKKGLRGFDGFFK